jgi:PAS domain S-box-containing protein
MEAIEIISQQLLQFTPDALIVVDSQGMVRFANATAEGLFRYRSGELVGQPLETLVPERSRIRHGIHVTGFLRNPSNREMGARTIDLSARRADGSEFPAGIRLAPFQAAGTTFVAAAIRDMTERRLISDALVAAREEADRANHAKTRFLATASHDLRQPLQTIRLLNGSALTMAGNDPAMRDLLLRQESAIASASRMLDALLDVTRLESGAIEPKLAPVALATVFDNLAREFQPQAQAKKLHVEFSDTQTVINTDRVLFSQLMQNLVGNALKYTEMGYVRVFQSADADALILNIEDSGVGIPEDKLARIFDEYYQVDPQGAQRSGVGLGLAIVREVSRLLGYSVSVASQLGSGTRVRVRIPAQRVLEGHVAPPPAALEPIPSAAAGARSADGCRVLLLEDNDSVRAALELFLSLEGYETRSAGSVGEAEALLADIRADDVLISDYHLDGTLTGLDVLQQLRSTHGRDIPAILLSGDPQSMVRDLSAPLARCRFLSKPVDSRALLAAIAELRGEGRRAAPAA